MTSVFTYGSLVVPEVWALVAGRLHEAEPARLSGFRRRLLRGVPYPGIAPSPRDSVEGVLWRGVSPQEVARLDEFEGEIYERLSVEVRAAGDPAAAEAYVLRATHEHLLSREAWDEAHFREVELTRYLEGCGRFAAARNGPAD